MPHPIRYFLIVWMPGMSGYHIVQRRPSTRHLIIAHAQEIDDAMPQPASLAIVKICL